MQINLNSGYSQPNFTAISSFPLKGDVKAVLNVITNKNHLIKKISCDVYEKENKLKQVSYKWKNGISPQMIDSASEKICKDLELPVDGTKSFISFRILELFKQDIRIFRK